MNDPSAEELHAQQVAAWSGPMGALWVASEVHTERALAPVQAALLAAAAPQRGEAVLDVGCGSGGTTLALAEAVGTGGRVVGLDVSETILALARTRLADMAQVELVCADAASWVLAGRPADLLFSRFGVMFFGDPVAAFGNLRASMAPGGRMVFACWQPLADNPWFGVGLRAIAGLVSPLPPPGPEEPGQFAFGDPARVHRILTQAGFAAPRIDPFSFAMHTPAADLRHAAEAMASFGPISRRLTDQPEMVREAAIDAIAAAIAPHRSGDIVSLGASVWLVATQPA